MSHDSWFHRLVRPAVPPLSRNAVTPNQVTWVRLLSGLAAAAALAQGDDAWRHAGALLFVLSFLLDRVDGELARHSGSSSAFGHKLDLSSDAAVNMLVFVGLGIGLRDGAFGAWSIGLGAVAGLAVGAILLLVWRIEALEGARAGELETVAGFDVDDAMLALPLGVWADFADPLLLLAGAGAPTFCVGLTVKFRRRLVGRAA